MKLAQILKHSPKKRTRRKARLPRIAPPAAQERWYVARLLERTEAMHEIIMRHVTPAYAAALPEIEATRPDSAVGDMFRTLGRARAEVMRDAFSDQEIESMAAYQFDSVRTFSAGALGSFFVAAIGFNPVSDGGWLDLERDKFVAANVDMIKTLPERHSAEVRQEVSDAFARGDRVETLQAKLIERYEGEGQEPGKARWNAERLARDQTLSLHAQLNELRCKELGIEAYIWRTMGDNRVRDRHEDRNGKPFRYDNPPEGGPPGTEIMCRCYEEPIIPGVNEQ